MRTPNRLLGAGLLTLGTAVATVAVLGPLVLDVLRYRVSATSLNQILGGDAAALAVVAPVTAAVGVLAMRGHRAAPVLALVFFPLLLAVFILAGAIALRAWSRVPAEQLPPTSVGTLRHRRWAGKPVYALLGAYTLIGASVAGMAITMVIRRDPDASTATAAGAVLLTALLAGLTSAVYRPLFRRAATAPARAAAPARLEKSTV